MTPAATKTTAGNTGQQIWLIARLRWLLLRSTFGTVGAKLDLVAKVIVGVIGGLVAIGLGLALGALANISVQRGRLGVVSGLLWGIFLAWQLFPLLLAVGTAQFQFRDLLRFPLRFSTFYLLSLMYALFDPVALSCIYWLICVGVGVAAARADLLPWVLLVMPVIGGVSLLFNRMIFSWLERVLAHRRAREVFLVLFVMSALSLQLLGGMAERLERESLGKYAQLIRSVAQVLPPGLAGVALMQGASGQPVAALSLTLATAGYGALFAIFLRRRLIAQYRGEDAMESGVSPRARAGSAKDAVAEASLAAPSFLRGTLAALIGKDLRYLRRNIPMLLQFVVPLFLIVMFTMMRGNSRRDTAFLERAGEMFFPYSVAYALLIIAPMAHNVFAFEGRGFNFLMIAPVRFREVLLAKNIVFGCAMLAETLVILLVISIFVGLQSPLIILITFAAVIFGAFVHVTLGNLLSIYYPRRFDFGQFKQRQSGISVLFGLLTQIVLMGIVAIVFLGARWLDQMWLAVVALATLVLAAWQVYVVVLEHSERIGERRREELTAELCKE